MGKQGGEKSKSGINIREKRKGKSVSSMIIVGRDMKRIGKCKKESS